MTDLKNLSALLAGSNLEERRALFQKLREEFPIHALEKTWNTTAEIILEAIARSGDLTQRGVRGVIAEASFKECVVNQMTAQGWEDKPIPGEQSYDFLLGDASGDIRIQVKMQRRKEQRPMRASEANKRMFGSASDMWVVETQRTRGGKDNDGEATRPYRYGEFDLLAVSLHPSTNNWADFRFTVANWLIPDPDNNGRIFKYQPVPTAQNADWTDNLLECITWLRSQKQKCISAS